MLMRRVAGGLSARPSGTCDKRVLSGGLCIGKNPLFPPDYISRQEERGGGMWGIGGIPCSRPGISLAFFHSVLCFTCLCIDMMIWCGGGLGMGDIDVMF